MKSFQVRETTTVLKTSSKQAIRIRWQVTIVERRNFFARLNIYIYTCIYLLLAESGEVGNGTTVGESRRVRTRLSLSLLLVSSPWNTRLLLLATWTTISAIRFATIAFLTPPPLSTIGEYYSTLRSSESSIRFSTYHDNTRYLWFHSRKCNFSSWRIRERFEKAGSKFNFNWKCILYRYTR